MAPVPGHHTFQGLLGIDMKTDSGTYELKVIATDTGQELLTKILTLHVEKASFITQRLTLPRHMVDLDPKTLERVNREANLMNAILKGYREERLWNGPFVRPVTGDLTTPFGARRILNDQPRNPHTGVDLRAPEGTPVRACNDGLVVLVDELFFNGKSVVLDHGWGMYSMYFHLSEAWVREGETATRGDVIGLAGSTGRASGPHLHWGIKLNGARVDPLSLLKLNHYLNE
jgi:murein DD-endopeptidase MepM/ murein hydrolase activator NlpD